MVSQQHCPTSQVKVAAKEKHHKHPPQGCHWLHILDTCPSEVPTPLNAQQDISEQFQVFTRVPQTGIPNIVSLSSMTIVPSPMAFQHLARKGPTMSKGFAFCCSFTTSPISKRREGARTNLQFYLLQPGCKLQSLLWPQRAPGRAHRTTVQENS